MKTGDILFLTGFSKVRESQQSRRHQQHDTHNQQSGTKDFFDLVLEEESHDGHRNHGDENIDHVAGTLVPFPFEKILENPNDLAPQDDDGTEHSGHMKNHGKRQVRLTVGKSEKRLADSQMTATADRKIFRETLNDA